MTDCELLSVYLGSGDQQAFTQLVQRYTNLVYSAALRQVNDANLADDITQTVFVLLSRKAGALVGERTILSLWLLKTTRYVAMNAIKYASRRRKHERKAAEMKPEQTGADSSTSAWQQVAPLLDDALDRLRTQDRAAVVLRFLQGKTHQEVGDILGLSEEAARKRITRALGTLRQHLSAKGVTVTAAALATALATSSAQAVPQTVVASACAAISAPPSTLTASIVSAGTISTKSILVIAATLVLLVGLVVWWSPWLPTAPATPMAQAGLPSPALPTAPAATADARQYLDLQVVDATTSKPVPGVTLTVQLDTTSSTATTDGNGQHRIYLPDQVKMVLAVQAKKAGLVPMAVMWRNDKLRGGMLRSYTLKMEKGTVIGGVVQDEQGKPVANATISLMMPGNDTGSDKPMVNIYDHQIHTDAQGRWRCDIMPAAIDDLLIRLSHPQYQSDSTYGAVGKPLIPALRDMAAVLTLKKGVAGALAGRVLDDSGKPIANAKVMQGSDRWGSKYPSTTTNAAGEFKFDNASPGQLVLTVQAPGFAPDLKELDVTANLQPIEFRLKPSEGFRCQVIDQSGKPVAGANVVADTWRKHRSITWQGQTNAEGQVAWDDAPADEVIYNIVKSGYMYHRSAKAKAGEQTQTFTLLPVLKLRGKVLDAKTGQPIPKFRVTIGSHFSGHPDWYWDERNSRTLADGWYELTASEPHEDYAIRIEADGYLPLQTPAVKLGSKDTTFDAKLTPGTGPAGTVHTPDGKPVADAQLAIANREQRAIVQNGKVSTRCNDSSRPQPRIFTTDSAGRFAIPPQVQNGQLVAMSEAGIAIIPVTPGSSSLDITLQPWSSIEGTLRSRKSPAAKAHLHAGLSGDFESGAPSIQSTAETDAAGHFLLTHLASGTVNVYRVEPTGDPDASSLQMLDALELKDGQALHKDFGGNGRTVIGHLVIPNPQWRKGLHCNLARQQPRPDYPDNWPEMTPAQQQDWWKEQPKARPAVSFYSVTISPDGSFIVEDVQAGQYTFNASVDPPRLSNDPDMRLASLARPITVEPSAPADSDKPLDIGTLELEALPQLIVGQPAIPLELSTLAGEPFRLADLRGKYVLIAMCSTASPYRGAAKLEAATTPVWDASAANGKLEIVNVINDPKAAWAKRYLAKTPMHGIHVYAGLENKASDHLPEAYWRSEITLIGPDGQVLATHLKPTPELLSQLKAFIKAR